MFGENELSSSAKFGAEIEISRLGVLVEKLGRAVNRQPGLPPGELFEQTCIDESTCIPSFLRVFQFSQLKFVTQKSISEENT